VSGVAAAAPDTLCVFRLCAGWGTDHPPLGFSRIHPRQV